MDSEFILLDFLFVYFLDKRTLHLHSILLYIQHLNSNVQTNIKFFRNFLRKITLANKTGVSMNIYEVRRTN